MNNILRNKPNTLEQLSFERSIIGLAGSGAGSVQRLVAEKFPNFVSVANNFFETMVRPKVILSSVNDDRIVIKLTKRNVNYSDLSRFTLYCTPGMSVDYLTFGETLTTIVDNIKDIETDFIVPFNQFIGSLINDRTRFETRRVNEYYSKIKPSVLPESKKLFKKVVSNNEIATIPYIKALPNHKAWNDVIRTSNNLVETLNKNSVSKVYESMKETQELLDSLSKIFDDVDLRETYDKEHNAKFNKGLFKQVADTTYMLAETIEFYAVVVYLVESNAVAIQDSLDKLNKTLLR